MSHFFKSIQIQNLLSFGPESPELELRPINLVIGPNGSGKSNLLAALSLFRPRAERRAIIENGGGYRNWFHEFNSEPKTAVKISFGNAATWVNSYEITLNENQNRCSFGECVMGGVAGGTDATRTKIAILDDELQDSIFFFRDWQYGPTAPVRYGPQPIDFSNKRIREDARNLAHVLKRVKEDARSYSVFMEFLSELYENIDDVQFTEAEDYLFFFVIEQGRKVPAARVSDGTLRYLALLAVLCDPEPPKLICLEEPEMGLHPDLIQIVAKAIRYASQQTQIIATTHSVLLVDKFTDSPESIVVCEKIDGSTELRRLDPEEMEPWLEEYRLGDLWTSGQIGGNRW